MKPMVWYDFIISGLLRVDMFGVESLSVLPCLTITPITNYCEVMFFPPLDWNHYQKESSSFLQKECMYFFYHQKRVQKD